MLLGLGVLLLVMLAGYLRLKRQTGPGSAPPSAARPAPVDLTQHDGQTIDFSSGRPVVKDTPADQAALAQALQEMDRAAKDVTFAPAPASTADQKPAPPAKP